MTVGRAKWHVSISISQDEIFPAKLNKTEKININSFVYNTFKGGSGLGTRFFYVPAMQPGTLIVPPEVLEPSSHLVDPLKR